ncbi:zf-HC2 domain-containing protein [Moraxella marmotae]|uniref:zf-HC2 domain-containing protein n=1 Tax=Moraxella marmotae TaxID=3344520 RepID=UPI0035F3E554
MKKCQKVTELLTVSYDRPLRLSQAAMVRLHLMICPKCRNFDKNNQILKQMVRQHKMGE